MRAMTVADSIRKKLDAAFTPSELSVEDESARHAGHSGARPEGETHFRVRIVSSAFEGMSRIERQRQIYSALDEELRTQVHALSVSALAPHETKGR
jgi:BolA protein